MMKKQSQEAQLNQRQMVHKGCVVFFLKEDLRGFKNEKEKKPRSSFFSFP